jgi:hypothetical protein
MLGLEVLGKLPASVDMVEMPRVLAAQNSDVSCVATYTQTVQGVAVGLQRVVPLVPVEIALFSGNSFAIGLVTLCMVSLEMGTD